MNHRDFPALLVKIIAGELPLPNVIAQEPTLWLNNLASGGHHFEPRWGHALIDNHRRWTMFFLEGAGMLAPPHIYGGGGMFVAYGPMVPICGTFAICSHTFASGPGANPQRGWHPGSCTTCGIDLTVDSGD